MSRREIYLLGLCVVLSGVIMALLFIYNWDFLDQLVQRAAPTVPVVPPPDGTEGYTVPIPPVVIDLPLDATTPTAPWLPLDRLDQMLGGWQTADRHVHVLVASRTSAGAAEPGTFWLQPYRLSIAVDGRLVVTCGLYERLQHDDPPADPQPWRLGYCRPPDLEGPSLLTRVWLLRQQGQDFLRLLLGNDIDIEIYQASGG